MKEFWQKVKDFFKNMSMKVRVLLGVTVVLVIAAIAALAMWSSGQPYETLFTNLSSTEASAIMSKLDEDGFRDYRLEGFVNFFKVYIQPVNTVIQHFPHQIPDQVCPGCGR